MKNYKYQIDADLYQHAIDFGCEDRYKEEVKRCIDNGDDWKSANESAYQEVEYIISGQEDMDKMADDMWSEIKSQLK